VIAVIALSATRFTFMAPGGQVVHDRAVDLK